MRVVSPFSEEGARQIATQGDEAGKIAYVDMEIPGDEWEDAGAIGRTLEEILPSADGLPIELGGAALGRFQGPSFEHLGLAFPVVLLDLDFGPVPPLGLPVG